MSTKSDVLKSDLKGSEVVYVGLVQVSLYYWQLLQAEWCSAAAARTMALGSCCRHNGALQVPHLGHGLRDVFAEPESCMSRSSYTHSTVDNHMQIHQCVWTHPSCSDVVHIQNFQSYTNQSVAILSQTVFPHKQWQF